MYDISMNYRVTSLWELINTLSHESLLNVISSFSCKMNTDVETFLKEKAIVQEKKQISRTYLIFTNDPITNLAAYFTIAVSCMNVGGLECSNELRKKMNINDGLAQSYLIGQLGKHDGSQKGLGKFALHSALELIKDANAKVGCRLLRIDCKPSLIKYYTENGFIHVKCNRDGDLELMIKLIDPGIALQSSP